MPTSISTRGASSDLARVVYAPENAALRQAAALKRRGNIDYLVAGPVNALFADEDDGILRLPEIDRLIVACEWARDFYRDAPQLLEKSVPCPCGVDPDALEADRASHDRTSRSSTGKAATKRSASRWSTSSGRVDWSRAACARRTASTRSSRPTTTGGSSTRPSSACS